MGAPEGVSKLNSWSRIARLSCLAATALAMGCGGNGHYTADSDWTQQDYDNLEGVGTPEEISDVPFYAKPYDWVGVRHDLIINPNLPRKERCSCLAVEVGPPTDEKFAWEGTAPSFSGSKLAVAISTRGVECQGGKAENARRPSIYAVDRVGEDTIVVVEELPVDRPLANGAIIDAPRKNGGVYVRPRTKNLPYAKPFNQATGMCRVF